MFVNNKTTVDSRYFDVKTNAHVQDRTRSHNALTENASLVLDLTEINPQTHTVVSSAKLKTIFSMRSVGVSFAGLRAMPCSGMVSIFSSTVAKVRPASFRRSGAGVIRLTTISTREHTMNMKIA